MWGVLVLLSVVTSGLRAFEYPPWIKRCKVGPTLEECILKNGNEAIPHIAKGDPKYKLPAFDPLEIPEISVVEGGSRSVSMNITLTNVKILGLRKSKLIKSVMDFKNHHVDAAFAVPAIDIECDYKISGKFLLLPIHGHGPAKISLDDVILDYFMDYKLEKRKDGEYAVITSLVLKHHAKKIHVQLDNLFNGDKNLGAHMNHFMNENWKELDQTIGPSIVKGINMFLLDMMSGMLKMIPFEQFFLH